MKTIGKNKLLAVLFWAMSVAVAVIIFMLSEDTGEESAQLSNSLLSLLADFLKKYISHNMLRKIAHFCEYAALGFFVGGGIKFTFNSSKIYFPLPLCALYSVSDEIHQAFVPERACRIFDMFIDTCGALTGILVFLLLIFVIEKIINKTRESKTEKNL